MVAGVVPDNAPSDQELRGLLGIRENRDLLGPAAVGETILLDGGLDGRDITFGELEPLVKATVVLDSDELLHVLHGSFELGCEAFSHLVADNQMMRVSDVSGFGPDVLGSGLSCVLVASFVVKLCIRLLGPIRGGHHMHHNVVPALPEQVPVQPLGVHDHLPVLAGAIGLRVARPAVVEENRRLVLALHERHLEEVVLDLALEADQVGLGDVKVIRCRGELGIEGSAPR